MPKKDADFVARKIIEHARQIGQREPTHTEARQRAVRAFERADRREK